MRSILTAAALCLAILAGCGPGGLRAGAQYSGMPDTLIGDPQRNRVTGTISTDGTVWSRQQGYLTTPRGY
ncbi:hypothetical protein [Paracraurococcus lichenis]|uniref:Rare lipoprotein A n=1 Tax=Paracraurococcus lichenis TaxID=3064888 RepID=A0ABT9DSQ1_9PROT|nr:hypothetical protein [Paracraurococcus sp. LOR1-02]MDO9706929.1 hypothetical protein [Paracraurococcus sp. LOR1-02]